MKPNTCQTILQEGDFLVESRQYRVGMQCGYFKAVGFERCERHQREFEIEAENERLVNERRVQLAHERERKAVLDLTEALRLAQENLVKDKELDLEMGRRVEREDELEAIRLAQAWERLEIARVRAENDAITERENAQLELAELELIERLETRLALEKLERKRAKSRELMRQLRAKRARDDEESIPEPNEDGDEYREPTEDEDS